MHSSIASQVSCCSITISVDNDVLTNLTDVIEKADQEIGLPLFMQRAFDQQRDLLVVGFALFSRSDGRFSRCAAISCKPEVSCGYSCSEVQPYIVAE